MFFRSSSDLRHWFEANHDTARELWIGFWKKNSGKAGISYAEALDEALCFGWIDGIRKTCDEDSYTNRFTPRKPASVWSLINTKRVTELTRLGRMARSGIDAFERRDPEKSKRYSYEASQRVLSPAQQKELKANRKAWAFFQAQPPGYRRLVSWWVISAKKEETQAKRLATLIELCERGERLPELARPSRQQKSSPESRR
jgi:uncharacterized protein YdeI (YjbR/CyaY-like superfamily)